MASAFTLEQCTVEDGPALSYNNMSAFWRNDIWRLSWDHVTLSQHIIETSKRIPRNLLNDRTHLRHQKAVSTTNGQIVGYARWLLPEISVAEDVSVWPEAMVPAVSAEEEAKIREIAEGANWVADNSRDDVKFEELMTSTKKRLFAARPYLLLDYLAVHPDNQGKGIASALVESGLVQARKLGLDVFVLAFPEGVGVYKRAGFQLIEEISTVYQLDSIGPLEYKICYLEYVVGNRNE